MATKASAAAEYILPLYMNGLSGRMLRLPAKGKAKRQILLIAGQHTSLERIAGMAEYLNRFGGVTSPDLPGFGGMQPLYKIGERPSVDIMASYLAAFVKFRYRRGRFSIIAVSYGFAVVTRMLQLYPEIAKRVDLLVSVSGIINKRDLRWKKHNVIVMHTTAWVLSLSLMAAVTKFLIIRGPIIRTLYRLAESKHPKLKGAPGEEREARINYEIGLWKANDFRTWMATNVSIFRLELSGRHVPLKVYHVAVEDDHFFDSLAVEQHMRAIYNDFEIIKIKLPSHAPTIKATAKDVEPFVPPRIRTLLRRQV